MRHAGARCTVPDARAPPFGTPARVAARNRCAPPVFRGASAQSRCRRTVLRVGTALAVL